MDLEETFNSIIESADQREPLNLQCLSEREIRQLRKEIKTRLKQLEKFRLRAVPKIKAKIIGVKMALMEILVAIEEEVIKSASNG